MNIRKHPAVVSRRDTLMIDPRQIKILDNWNPRIEFDSAQDDLNRDIYQNGVKESILLKLTSSDDLVLIDGERRLRAALWAIEQGANIVAIPAEVANQKISDSNALKEAIIRNHSKPFLPMEEAEAYSRLLKWGSDIKTIARDIGKEISYIRQRLSLLEGCPEVQKALNEKKLPTYLAEKIITESEGSIERQKKLVKEATSSKEGKNRVKDIVAKTLNIERLGDEKYWKEEDNIYEILDNVLNNLDSKEYFKSNKTQIKNIMRLLDKRASKFKK